MGSLKILNEQPITMSELKAELEAIQKRDGELNYRANKTVDYLNQFSMLDHKKAKELIKKIKELDIPRLRDIHMYKIVDVMPATPEELKAVLQGYTLTVSQDNMKKILGVVKDYLPKK